ncbi:unnamed protein product, partial [Musa acuminata subsp. burmannicoides]
NANLSSFILAFDPPILSYTLGNAIPWLSESDWTGRAISCRRIVDRSRNRSGSS